jgi:LysM repeat protein
MENFKALILPAFKNTDPSMKKIFFLLLIATVFIDAGINAQTTKYTLHTLAPGETLSALAVKYHTTVGDIMRLNGMNSKSVLKTGEKIKIPAKGTVVKAAPVAQTPPAQAQKKSLANTHFVLESETLYSISKKFNVSVEDLKQWNNLPDNNIHFGQQLFVSAPTAAEAAKQTAAPSGDTTKQQTESPPAEEKVALADTAQKIDTAQKSIQSSSVDYTPTNTIITVPQQSVNPDSMSDNSNGYFAKDFPPGTGNTNIKSISGDAMTFKSASGWANKKYYILTNEAPTGSIVKVSSANGKTIYAKVLWKLDDMKINQGLQFRISDAAASALNIGDAKFNLTIQYYE